MDLTFSLLTMHGKKYISVLVDYSIEYLYFLTIYEQCIAPQKSKSIFGFQGHFRANVCNDSSPSIHDFGQVYCYFIYVQLIDIDAYFPMLGEKTYTSCNFLQDHLPYDILKQQLGRLRNIHLENLWYHPKLHLNFSNFLIWRPNGDDVPFILDGMVWVDMSHDFRGRVLGGSIFFLPLEINHVAAQDQHAFYTYHKWRGGHRGIGPLAYHVHSFNPPTF